MEYEDDAEQRDNERKERRWNIPIPVFIKGIRSDGTEFSEGTITADASPTGMCVLLTVELRKGDQVTVTAPEEKFESPATVLNVSSLGPNMNRIRVIFPKNSKFARDSAAKKYVYDYQLGNWVGYILDEVYYNTKFEPFGRVSENKILLLDTDQILFILRAGGAYDIRGSCIGHII